jgi:uncharacterized protein (DUF1800 family)
MVSRASFVFLLMVSITGLGCEVSSPQAHQEHVLNRIGYGPDAWSRNRIEAIGVDAYVAEQLFPGQLDDSALEARLRSTYPALTMSLSQLRSYFNGSTAARGQNQVRQQLTKAKLLRAVHSKRQLEQVLVDFWFNHFNVDARREIATWAIVPFERDAIRPHVLGRFEDMLRAVVRHPAMLEYLDNAQNFRDGFVRSRETYGVNENFARELLELHTVGPGAGQTLTQIRDAALAFTGWTVPETIVGNAGFVYLDAGHDRSAKRILGLSMPAGRGIEDGNALIRYLARHPDTAVQIARKLCRRFVAERATGCEVAAAARYLASGGDLRQTTREILRSEAFHDPRYFRGKVKSPLHAVASVARAVGVASDKTFAESAMSDVISMGEELYGAAQPNGWPDVSEAWLGEGALLWRLNLAYRAAAGQSGLRAPASLGTTQPGPLASRLLSRLLLGGAGPATEAELVRYLGTLNYVGRLREGTALVLSGPEFAHH